jgi:hypothetical protein
MPNAFSSGFALLIGVNQSKTAGWELPTVANDVTRLAEVLLHPNRCGYEPDNVRLLKGSDATRGNIVEGLDWLDKAIAKDKTGNATAIVYYSGHGHVEGSGKSARYFLIPYDTKRNLIATSALDAKEFAAAVANLQPRRLLTLLDCCHAGGVRAKSLDRLASVAIPPIVFMLGTKATKNRLPKTVKQLAQGAGRAAISSSRGKEKSWIRKDATMSVFTYHLIEALTGHAQPPGQTEVLVSELMGHVYRCVPATVRAEQGMPQNPEYVVEGMFPVALVLGGAGSQKGTPAPDPIASLPQSSVIDKYFEQVGTVNFTTQTVKNSGTIGTNVLVGQDWVGGNKTENTFLGSLTRPATREKERQVDKPRSKALLAAKAAPEPSKPVAVHDSTSFPEQLKPRTVSRDRVSDMLHPVLQALINGSARINLPRALSELSTLGWELERGDGSDPDRIAATLRALIVVAPEIEPDIHSLAQMPDFSHLAAALKRSNVRV